MRSPSKVARLLLALVVCSTIFADYWEYSRAYHATPDIWMDVARGTAAAPQQYRIGVVWAAGLLSRHGHMGLRHAFTLIDFLSVSVAVFLLTHCLSARWSIARRATQRVGLAQRHSSSWSSTTWCGPPGIRGRRRWRARPW